MIFAFIIIFKITPEEQSNKEEAISFSLNDFIVRYYPYLKINQPKGCGWTRRNNLEKIIQSSPASNKIHMLGRSDKVEEMLTLMDVFVLPSYANEGVPQAIMQAMAAELPVVSTNVGAIAEAVIDGATGTLINIKDVSAISVAIETYLKSESLRIAHGKAGRLHVVEHFSLDNMLDKMTILFKSAIAER